MHLHGRFAARLRPTPSLRSRIIVARSTSSMLDKITVTHEGASAEVCLHGGHVISWKDPAGQDLLFVSSKALFEPPKAIRGGVPICFPQFGMMGPMSAQHGFARNTAFTVESQSDGSATLLLKYDGKGHAAYPHPFELRTIVSLGPSSFVQELRVTNTGDSPMSFTCALHTYYKVGSIGQVKVTGPTGRYLDNLQGQKEVAAPEGPITFQGEVDRVYLAAPDVIQVVDEAGGRVFEITKSGFPDAVVWNPWIDKAAKMSDFGDEEYKVMVCIEPAVAGSGPVALDAGGTWSGSQSVTCRQLHKL